MSAVPLWIVASLGKHVELVKGFEGPCETYPAGYSGRLVSIQAGDESMHVTVQLDPDDWGYEENFAFDEIMPASRHVKMSLDLENGIVNF